MVESKRHDVKLPRNMRGLPDASVITLHRGENPKRGAAATRYALYRDGMTVGDYVKAVTEANPKNNRGLAIADLAWDTNHGFITVNAATQAPAEVGEYEASEEQAA
jgi:hypothetical protein